MPPNTQPTQSNDSSDEEFVVSPCAHQLFSEEYHLSMVNSLEQTGPQACDSLVIDSKHPPSSLHQVDLSMLSQAERQALYEEAFSWDAIPIERLAKPSLFERQPRFANEIQCAYFQYNTFNFKVWTNYDACEKKFYTDERYNSCGLLMLTPKSRRNLKSVMADKFLFQNVRLDIGTPFCILARITIELRPSKLDVGPRIDTFVADSTNGEHPWLMKLVETRCHEIGSNENDITAGKDGFGWEDLCTMAKLFTLWPSEAANQKRYMFEYDGPYTKLKRPPYTFYNTSYNFNY